MKLDFQPMFIDTLSLCFCKASVSMKMNRNSNMVEDEIRGKKLGRVVKYPGTWDPLSGICVLLKM